MKSCLRRRKSNVRNDVSINEIATTVTFNLDKSNFLEVDRLTDLSLEHIMAIWYSHDDYVEFKNSIKPIIREMMRNNGRMPEESDEFTSRGLECRTKLGARSKARARENAIHCVLEEQAVQRDEGLPDPDFIAEIYKEYTGVSAIEALNRGLKDQKFGLDGYDPNQRPAREPRTQKLESPKSLPVAKKRKASVTQIVHKDEVQSLEVVPTL